RVEVGVLSFGATRRLLLEQFGLTLPRQIMRRLYDSTLGNPLFAVEMGRMLVARSLPETDDDIPLPDAVEDLLGTRVAQLSAHARTLLLAVALQADLRVSQLAALGDESALEEALVAEVLLLDCERVSPADPRLAGT